MLAITQHAERLSLVAQLAALLLAVVVGRFSLKSRSAIWLAAFAGAGGAMFVEMCTDGQGGFLMLVFAPVVYFVATVGRRRIR